MSVHGVRPAFEVGPFDEVQDSLSVEQGTCDRWRVRVRVGAESYGRLQEREGVAGHSGPWAGGSGDRAYLAEVGHEEDQYGA